MADSDSNSKRKKLRLKGTTDKDENDAGAQPNGGGDSAPAADGEQAAEPKGGDADSVQDPLEARDTQLAEKLKRMSPEDSPAAAQAMTESGRLAPPGSDTVRLKVVKEASSSSQEDKKEAGETIRLRSGDKSEEASPADTPAAEAGDTMRIKPSGDASADSNTHTATLRVPKHPKHKSREDQTDSGTRQADTAGETQKSAKPAKTATETMRVTPRETGAEKTDESAAGEEAGQTQSVQPNAEGKTAATSTSTLKVARPGQGGNAGSDGQAADEHKGGDTASAKGGPGETQPAVPASGTSKTSTAPLKKEDREKAKAEEAKGDNSSNETIRIKPPSQIKTFGQDEQKESGGDQAGDAAAATRKGPAKVTMKVKKRGADSSASRPESQEGKATVPASAAEPEPQAQEEQEAPKGRKTLRLKTGSESEDKVSAERVEKAVAQTESGAEPSGEPGIVMTVAQAAALIGVGVLVFFTVYQYLSLLS